MISGICSRSRKRTKTLKLHHRGFGQPPLASHNPSEKAVIKQMFVTRSTSVPQSKDQARWQAAHGAPSSLAMLGKLMYSTGLHSANAVDVESRSLKGRKHLSEGAGPQPESTIRATWVSKEA